MARTVGIGHQDFAEMRMKNNFYIDKTEFIREWWEADDQVTLITRPRRFGKTLNMSMLEYFFSCKYAGRADLFTGLCVWDHEKYRSMQGTYPVLFLSFADVKFTSFQEARRMICLSLEALYNKHDFLLEGNLLNEKEKAFYREVSANMADSTASVSLRSLSDFLSRYYRKKVIILLDEYDTPMQEAFVAGYWDEMAEFVRNLFNSTFKTNPYLQRAILTGITRISKESIFSDLNNLEVITTTSGKYETAFGFTEAEVWDALEEYGLSDRKQEIKAWYDGFTFGKVTDIYNPWSIINYLGKKKLAPYWVNTSSNRLAGNLLRESSRDRKLDFECLLRGESIRVEIDEQIVYDQLSSKKNALWSLLLASGYLKVIQEIFAEESGEFYYELALTNKEVRIMFRNLIRDWFSEDDYYNDFIKALLLDDVEAMNIYMNKVTVSTFRYFDTGKKESEEELKVKGKNEKELSDTVKAALQQIDRQNYEASLTEKGILKEHIRKYGFAFQGKNVLIGS